MAPIELVDLGVDLLRDYEEFEEYLSEIQQQLTGHRMSQLKVIALPKKPSLLIEPQGFFLLESRWKRDKWRRWVLQVREKDLREHLEELALEMEKRLLEWGQESVLQESFYDGIEINFSVLERRISAGLRVPSDLLFPELGAKKKEP